MAKNKTVELAVMIQAQKYYPKAHINFGGVRLTYDTKFRKTRLELLAEEYVKFSPKIEKCDSKFGHYKELLIIRYFTNFGFEKYSYTDNGTRTMIKRVRDLLDLPYEDENISMLDKIISLFPEEELKLIDQYIEEELLKQNEK